MNPKRRKKPSSFASLRRTNRPSAKSRQLSAFLLLITLFRFFGLLEIQDHTVDAITEAGGWRAVVENMPQVGFTTAAHDFGAIHSMAVVGVIDYAAFADGLIKAGPATTTFKFGITDEEGIATGGTIIGSFVFQGRTWRNVQWRNGWWNAETPL